MKHRFKPIFKNSDPIDIACSLRTILETKLFEKYGSTPDPIIMNRVDEEWIEMIASNTATDVAALYELVLWLKKNDLPYWMRGCAGSSFLLYLLDITYGNPLPAHYHCPKCHEIYWDLSADGFDLPGKHRCEKDSTFLVPDGHDIPWQIHWGCGEYVPVFDIDLPRSLQKEFSELLNHHWLKISTTPDEPLKPDLFGNGIVLSQLHFKFTLEDVTIHRSFHRKKINASCTSAALRAMENLWGVQPSEDMDITSFADLIYWGGILHSSLWDHNTTFMHHNLGYKLCELVAFRDDIFSYLLQHGFSLEEAWEGTKNFCLGKGLPEISEDMERASDKWILSLCRKVSYLFPKAHIVEWIFFRLKASILPEQSRRMNTGFITVDGVLQGIDRSDLILLGGRPAIGHVFFASDIMAHLALAEGKKVALFTVLTVGEYFTQAVAKRQQTFPPHNFSVQECLSFEISDIRNYLTKNPTDVLVIDSLQSFRGVKKKRSDHTRVIMSELKRIAKEFRIPIFLISSLSRKVSLHRPPYPTTKFIPCYKEVLPYADAILLFYREAYYDSCASRDTAWVFIEKNARGRTGAVTLKWNDEEWRFENPILDTKDPLPFG